MDEALFDMIFLHLWNEPIQARLVYIKYRFIEKLLSGEFIGPQDRGQGSHCVECGMGVGRRKDTCGQRKEKERARRDQKVWII